MVRSLNDTLSYIGVDDLRIDLFESQYPVPEGISYNSYVLRAGKTAVFDTVDASASEQWKANLSEALAETRAKARKNARRNEWTDRRAHE